MDSILNLDSAAPLSVTTLVINMLIGLVLAILVAGFYTRYGRSFSNRSKLASIIPVLALITILIISVVKSSIALSLGLVGALSIVRFRTAIKEPEELIYLFWAIGIGLGLGADQRWATVAATVIIMAYLFARTFTNPRIPKNNLFLNVTTADQDNAFGRINEVLRENVEMADLRRLDHNEAGFQATYLIKAGEDSEVSNLLDDLQAKLPDCEISFVEQDSSWSG